MPEEGNGYIKFPDGTLIQWGRASFPGSGSGGAGYATVDFAIPFVSSPAITATAMYVNTLVTFGVSAQSRSDGATLYARTSSGGIVTGASAYWVAVGKWK